MPSRKNAAKKNSGGKAEEGPTTFSTRLSTEQKRLVEDAAALKNWTPSNLIRIASVEKAAQIVNVNRPTRFGFAELADRVAQQLCRPSLVVLDPELNKLVEVDWPVLTSASEQKTDSEVEAESLQRGELALLREALQLGGTEFMQLVIAGCQRRLSKSDLPEPIDPASFS